jgi:hypothetical protein
VDADTQQILAFRLVLHNRHAGGEALERISPEDRGCLSCSPRASALQGAFGAHFFSIPQQLSSVQDALAAAKDSFQKGDYQQALSGAKDLASKAKDLAAAVIAKKDELTKNWQDMSGGLPGILNAIQSKVNILSKSRALPVGLDKAKFDSAKTSLASITQTMADASSAFKGGNLVEAVNNANTVKDKAAEIMNTLGMKPPQASMK